MGWFQRLSEGLGRTRNVMQQSMDRFLGRAPDEELLEDLEAALLAADLGASAVDRLMRQCQGRDTRGRGENFRRASECLKPVAL